MSSEKIYFQGAQRNYLVEGILVSTINVYFNPFIPTNQYADTFINSADPDETARNELSHKDLHGLPFCY